MLKKVEKFEKFFDIILGARCIFKGDKEAGIKPFYTRLVGMDLTAFQSGLQYVMIEYSNGLQLSETKFEDSEIVYYKDTKFMWCNLDNLTFLRKE